MKIRKDRIFIMVAAITTANLGYQLIKTLLIISSGIWTSIFLWVLVIVDAIAIVGILWLLQNYRKRRRIEEETENNEIQNMD